MSWRFLIFFLLVAAGFSAWGGINLGNWLIAHGPEQPVLPEAFTKTNTEVLDADGNPYRAQPPQPLLNGRLGTPEQRDHIDWEIPSTSLAKASKQPPIAISTSRISASQIQELNEEGSDDFKGLASIGDLFGSDDGTQSDEIIPIDVQNNQQQEVNTNQTEQNSDWQAQLREEIEACRRLGFFERPTCSWNARNKYCGPNNAWGQIKDCPAKSSY